jgi:hypothetical protein
MQLDVHTAETSPSDAEVFCSEVQLSGTHQIRTESIHTEGEKLCSEIHKLINSV